MIESVINEVTSGSGRLLAMGAGVLTLGGGVGLKGFVRVEQGSVGLRTHRERPYRRRDSVVPGRHKQAGELYGWVGPGIHPVVPFTHGIRQISVQNQLTPLEDLKADTKEGKQQVIRSAVVWGVAPPTTPDRKPIDYGEPYDQIINRALFTPEGNSLGALVVSECMHGLREVVKTTPDPREASSEEYYEQMAAFCGESLFGKYGVELRGFMLKETARSDSSVLADGMERARNLDEQIVLGQKYLGQA